jgi:hypothetical protein
MNLSPSFDLAQSPIYCPYFKSSSFGPIELELREHFCPSANRDIAEIIRRYHEDGFAHFSYQGNGNEVILWIASRLKLGRPFVPVYNRRNPAYSENGYNIIRISPSSNHRAFASPKAQGLHVDGTLTTLGMIKTSVLLCEAPAEIGGETTLFKAVAAFARLMREDPEIGTSLLRHAVLTRRDVGASQECETSPAFAIEGNELLSRFSVDNTSCWAKEPPQAVAAFTYLKQLARAGSPFYHSFKLRAHEGIIIANDKISHGRRKYYERSAGTRCMLRALFIDRPTALNVEPV